MMYAIHEMVEGAEGFNRELYIGGEKNSGL